MVRDGFAGANPPVRPQSRWEVAALLAVPLLADLAVAILVVLLISRSSGVPTGLGPIDLVPVGPEIPHAGPLPVADFALQLATVEAATGHTYDCLTPWTMRTGSIKWACRSTDLLIVIEANALGEVYQLDATWFGFDRERTDLPAWASATQGQADRAAEIGAWVASHVGISAELRVGRAVVSSGGARGAYTLRVSG
jgi:hypothetical protein